MAFGFFMVFLLQDDLLITIIAEENKAREHL